MIGSVPGSARLARPQARYRIGEQLAAGGMGTIHKAYDLVADRPVAYKRLRVDREVMRPRMTALFRQEYETLLALQHPNTVAAYDYGFDAVGPYYTMELLTGADLVACAPLPWRQACRVVRDVASALALVHARRLVHRDLSPHNVMRAADGSAKLLDFGALTPFGLPAEIIGTPAFMAPESLRAGLLDARTDLFALGALAYWSLTQRACFPVRSLDELEDAWERPFLPPSSLVEGIPTTLDTLVASLLQRDPSSRPTSAAFVIERLTAIAGLPSEENPLEIAFSYLRRPPLVEREEPRRALRRALDETLAGTGAMVLLEAAPGMGRTALLEQLVVDAQLAGANVLRGEGGTHTGPYALCRQLVQTGWQSGRSEDPQGGDSTLREFLREGDEGARSAAEASTRRAQMATSLRQKLFALSLHGPLAIVIDDAQDVDAASLAVIASLADEIHAYPLLVVISVPAGERLIDSHVRATIERQSIPVSLAPLSEAGVIELVQTACGAVPNAQRSAVLLHHESAGNPQITVNLLSALLQRGEVSYADGLFTFPHEIQLSTDDSGDDLVLARAADLDVAAHDLLQLLSLHDGALSLAHLIDTSGRPAPEVVRALARLSQRGIVFVSKDRYYVASKLLRAALLRRIDPARARQQHAALARAITAHDGPDMDARFAAGHHMILSGGDDELAGAELIGRVSLENAFEAPSFTHLVPRLREALAVYRKHGRTDGECLDLLVPLTVSGFYGDLEAQRAFLDPTLDALCERTGVATARRLVPRVGDKLAIQLGLLWAFLCALFMRGRSVASLKLDLERICVVVGAASAASATAGENAEAYRIAASVAPFAALPLTTPLAISYEFALATAELAAARRESAFERYSRLLPIVSQPIRNMHESSRVQLRLGCLHGQAHLYAELSDARALELADELEKDSAFAPFAETIRVGYYANRGDERRLELHRARAETLALRGGLTWSAISILTLRLIYAYALFGNVVGLVRAVGEIERLSHLSGVFALYREMAEAHLESLRGHYARAIATYERLIDSGIGEQLTAHRLDCALYADALNGAGLHARAKDVCERALGRPGASNADHDAQALRQRLAITESLLGNHELAASMLDTQIANAPDIDNPLLGLLHCERAQVAVAMRDVDGFEHHAQATEALLSKLESPSLMSKYEALMASASRANVGTRARLALAAARVDSLDELNSTVVEPAPAEPPMALPKSG